LAWVVRQVSPVIASHEGQGMDPFRDYRQVFPAHARHCPSGGCVVCCSQSALTRREFADLVNRTWSPGERDLLREAAPAALL
jgi:hypothetical protein